MTPNTYQASEVLNRLFILFTLMAILFIPRITLADDTPMDEKSAMKQVKNQAESITVEKMENDAINKPLMDDIPDWKARWELARLLSYTKRYDDAIYYYRKVMNEKPKMFEIREELARVLYWSGDKKEAMDMMGMVPEEELRDESLIIYGDLYAFEKDYEKAAYFYNKYLEKTPNNPDVRLRLAEVLSWNKDYDASIEAYKKVIEARPDDIQVRRKYALVLSWAQKYNEAIEQLKKTLP